MRCNNCNTDLAARVRIGFDSNGQKWELCDICGKVPSVWLPDVYLGGTGGRPQQDEQLWDSNNNRPFEYSTKREKAVIMKMLGLRQADSAEHQHGARNETKRRKYFC